MGSISILNNASALYAQNQLSVTYSNLNQAINRLSSGKRINTGADDAAGLMIADTLAANTTALNQGVQNANDCISIGQIADSALQEITSLLTRGVTLAEEAAQSTVDTNGATALNNEFSQITDEISRIANQTNFNGKGIFTSSGLNGSMSVFVGDIFSTSSIAVTVNMIDVNTLGADSNNNIPSLASTDLMSDTNATTALTSLKNAIIQVANNRAEIGAGMNRLQAAVQVMQSQSLNTQSAESTIRDANMAQEISNLTKYQILSQSGIAALSQANAESNTITSLLRNLG